MIKKIRIGILGGGSNSAIGLVHISSLRMDGRFEIGPSVFSHLESENKDSHEKYGLNWNGKQLNVDQWLAAYAGELDLVAVLTPSTDHVDHITKVLAHGLPFVCEKPIGCSADDIDKLQKSLLSANNQPAYFIHNYSGYPMFRELVQRTKEGKIGKIHHVKIEMPSDGFARERIVGKPQAWRLVDPEVPMIMLDLGTHMHHLVQMVLGPSQSSLMTRMSKMINSFDVVDNVEIWEKREDSVEVTYWMSKAHLGIKNGLRIDVFGSEGSLTWIQMDPDHIFEADINSNVTMINRGSIRKEITSRDRFKAGHPTGFVEAFAYFYSDLADDFLAQKQGGIRNQWIRPIGEAMMGVKFLSTAAKSHMTGKWVSL